MSILSVITELRSTNSRLEKEAILKKHVDNSLLKSVMIRALASHIQYYQRKIPAYSTNGENVELIEALERMNDLADRKVTGNKAIEFLSNILSDVSADDAKVIELIIKKDLDCGVSTPTVNKIWKDLIPTFDTMLCTPMSDKVLAKMVYPAIVQCLSEDWNVETDQGIMSIKTLCEEFGNGNLEGISVKSYNHKTNSLEFKEVINYNISSNKKQWISLSYDGKHTKPLTVDHLVWCVNKNDYIRADKLEEGDEILLDS